MSQNERVLNLVFIFDYNFPKLKLERAKSL